MADGPASKTESQVPTNLRLVMLIEAIAQSGDPVNPSDLGRALGLPKATVHRLLNTAENEGLVQRHIDGRSYGPGPRMRRLAVNTLSSARLRTERVAILKSLADALEETCNVALPDREGMTYLERVETHWPLRIQLPIGTTVPFHCTASGKMFLASLRKDKLDRLLSVLDLEARTDASVTDPELLRAEIEKTRTQGYATDDGEFMEGMAAIAVPVRDDLGRLMCTLSIHAPIQRRPLRELLAFLPSLSVAAEQLEAFAQE